VGVAQDIAALVEDAGEQIAAAAKLHDEALSSPAARGSFKARVKNVLEAQRSALDYLAVEITNRYGTPEGLIYYPLASGEREFLRVINSRMPGVESAEPTIAAAIKRFQPWQPDGLWMRELNQLTREQKHNRLSPQLVRQTYECEVVEKATGSTVRWWGVRFVPGMIQSEGGMIDFTDVRNDERPSGAPKPFELGGPTGVLVFGVPLNPATQRPYPTAGLEVRSGPLEQWAFTSPHKAVIPLLAEFQGWVRMAVTEISQAARL
jgi:hypothetical protein